MFERDEQGRMYSVLNGVDDLSGFVGCRISAVHCGNLDVREGVLAFAKYHESAKLWEVAFKGDVPTLNMIDGTWRQREWRVIDERIQCTYCGAQNASPYFVPPIGERMRKFSVCFTCDTWLNVICEEWNKQSKFRTFRQDVPGGGLNAPNWVAERLPDLIAYRSEAA